MTLTGEWPLRDHLCLGAMPGAVPCARLHTRLVLAEWGLACLTEQAQLIVSELVTNAVPASQQLPGAWSVWLWLLADSNWLLMAVWDASPQLPVRPDVDELAENGRGLLLVDGIAAGWDAYPTPDWGGEDRPRHVRAVTRQAEAEALAPARSAALILNQGSKSASANACQCSSVALGLDRTGQARVTGPARLVTALRMRSLAKLLNPYGIRSRGVSSTPAGASRDHGGDCPAIMT
jgi:hypothetical protein